MPQEKPKNPLELTVKEFINAAIEMGKATSFSPTRYFDMARRVGAKYGVSVNIPTR